MSKSVKALERELADRMKKRAEIEVRPSLLKSARRSASEDTNKGEESVRVGSRPQVKAFGLVSAVSGVFGKKAKPEKLERSPAS